MIWRWGASVFLTQPQNAASRPCNMHRDGSAKSESVSWGSTWFYYVLAVSMDDHSNQLAFYHHISFLWFEWSLGVLLTHEAYLFEPVFLWDHATPRSCESLRAVPQPRNGAPALQNQLFSCRHSQWHIAAYSRIWANITHVIYIQSTGI